MSETALFIGWGGVHPGRERIALDGYHEWLEILEDLKAKGEIEDFVNVVLGPHGGELDGFTLVFGEQVKLLQISQREDVHRLQLMAGYEFAKFSVIPAIVGERIEREFKLGEEILPTLERTPVAV